jgi:hypothetical protein
MGDDRLRIGCGEAELKANMLSGNVIRIIAPKSSPILGSIRGRQFPVAPTVRIPSAPPPSPRVSGFSARISPTHDRNRSCGTSGTKRSGLRIAATSGVVARHCQRSSRGITSFGVSLPKGRRCAGSTKSLPAPRGRLAIPYRGGPRVAASRESTCAQLPTARR